MGESGFAFIYLDFVALEPHIHQVIAQSTHRSHSFFCVNIVNVRALMKKVEGMEKDVSWRVNEICHRFARCVGKHTFGRETFASKYPRLGFAVVL